MVRIMYPNGSHEILKAMIRQIVETQTANGKTIEQIKLLLLNMEPFNNFPELVEIIEGYD